jgi:hypothetical protein
MIPDASGRRRSERGRELRPPLPVRREVGKGGRREVALFDAFGLVIPAGWAPRWTCTQNGSTEVWVAATCTSSSSSSVGEGELQPVPVPDLDDLRVAAVDQAVERRIGGP